MEKILKRPDGSRVKLLVGFNVPFFTVNVFICEPGKRKYKSVYDTDDYFYRRLSMEDRRGFIKQKQLDHVTPEEIHEAKLELWQSFKPKL